MIRICRSAPWRCLSLVLLHLGPLTLFAGELAFVAIPEHVRRHAPELRAARAARTELEARREAAGWKPASALTLEAQPGLAGNGVGSLQIGLERPLARPERLRLEKEVLAREIPVAEARLLVREVELIAAAREAAVSLLLAPLRAEQIDRQQRAISWCVDRQARNTASCLCAIVWTELNCPFAARRSLGCGHSSSSKLC